jgi:hypothetical protein
MSALALGQVTTWFQTSITTPTGITGSLNWSERWIQVVGYGIPPTNAVNMSQGQLLARQGAIMDAQRNLLNVIGYVDVTAESTMLNYMANDVVRTAVEGSITHAQIVQGSDVWSVPEAAKGDWKQGIYGITLQYNLDQLLLFIYPQGNAVNRPGGGTGSEVSYTGVVIDARGYRMQPSLYIKLVDPQGDPVAEAVAAAYVPSTSYTLSGTNEAVVAATNDPRVGSNPLGIRALGTDQTMRNWLVISEADAALIRKVANGTDILMRGDGAVLVVSD